MKSSLSKLSVLGLLLIFVVSAQAWAQVTLPFNDEFNSLTLAPSWQDLPGEGSDTLTGTALRTDLAGPMSSTTGWVNPAHTRALTFTGTNWTFETKATYNLKWCPPGQTYTGPAVPTTSCTSGAQGPEVIIKFNSGTSGSNYAGSDYVVIERDIDAYYGSNLIVASYGNNSSNNLLDPADSTIQNNIAGGVYWFRIVRSGGTITVKYSRDGSNFAVALSASLANPSSTYNELLIGGITYSTAGSFADYDYVHITNDAGGCQVNVASGAVFQFPSAGGTLPIVFQGGSACSWAISGLPSWITASGPLTGTGPATVNLTVLPNSGSDRATIISADGLSVMVTQSGAAVSNPIPSLTGLSVNTVSQGAPGFFLIATGTNFVSGAVVRLNGNARATTFLSNSQVQASVLDSDLASPGTLQVTVTNPLPGGGTSNALPLTVQSSALTTTTGTFSQLAWGSGWDTALTLVNISDKALNCHLTLYSETGTPLALPLVLPDGSQITASAIDLTIPPQGTAIVSTSESPASNIIVGWAQVQASGPSLDGYAIFRYRAGFIDWEGTAPLETSDALSLVLSYENVSGYQTGVSLVNAGTADAAVRAVVRDETGTQIGLYQLTIPPLGHTSFFVNNQFPVTANRSGTVTFETTAQTLTGLGLRFSPAQSFTSIPIIKAGATTEN